MKEAVYRLSSLNVDISTTDRSLKLGRKSYALCFIIFYPGRYLAPHYTTGELNLISDDKIDSQASSSTVI